MERVYGSTVLAGRSVSLRVPLSPVAVPARERKEWMIPALVIAQVLFQDCDSSKSRAVFTRAVEMSDRVRKQRALQFLKNHLLFSYAAACRRAEMSLMFIHGRRGMGMVPACGWRREKRCLWQTLFPPRAND